MTGPDARGIPAFDRCFFESERSFSRIGSGGLGGKATGLQLVREQILPQLGKDEFPLFAVEVPTLTVLATDSFDAFMRENRLSELPFSEMTDDRIAHAFQRAELPALLVGDLRALIARVHTPLAVRSSSLLEDSLEHPLAGVYATKMIPNNEIEVDARFRRLIEAVKLVYASTYFADARSFRASIGQSEAAERMAVIIQEVVGQRSGDRYYPCISGVARSYNYYPSGSARPEEGVVYLALGLGKTIVDGGRSWGYCPTAPNAPPPFNDIGELLKNTQTGFWAVNMGPPPLPDPILETECMVECSLGAAEADGSLAWLVSTYEAGSDRLVPGLGRGPRALTFAPLLGSRLVPFNDLIRRLLALSEKSLGQAVEIEFAVTLDRRDGLPARLGFLQVRPMMVTAGKVDVDPAELEGDDVLLASDIVLGNGARFDLTDVVYLKPETFDPALTPRIALELGTTNQELMASGRSCLLIGFGRWGTSDPWLGVPVGWGQISSARVIVEATLPGVNPDLSQGSHFFHNLLAFQVLFISVLHDGAFRVDWDWLASQPAIAETNHVRHVRLARPLEVRVDGRRRLGVVKRPK